ncbi:VOC family protein [Cystobacter fuscus]|uniref:VOC family protein n=1 Tax=Cystobacter fuscus TaxID=43 RepID=UPI0037BFE06A
MDRRPGVTRRRDRIARAREEVGRVVLLAGERAGRERRRNRRGGEAPRRPGLRERGCPLRGTLRGDWGPAGGGHRGLHASWMYYVTVEDLDAALARATAKGARVLNGPMEVPGGQRIVQLMDPQGAAFALTTPPTSR